jgi:hypothetical protein
MRFEIEYKNFYNTYTIINGFFSTFKTQVYNKFVKISNDESFVYFEACSDNNYIKIKYEVISKKEDTGSICVDFETFAILNSLKENITLIYEDGKLSFLTKTKRTNSAPIDEDLKYNMPFGKFKEIELKNENFISDLNFLKLMTADADVTQDRFKNILIDVENNTVSTIANNSYLITFVNREIESDVSEKFFISRSIIPCLFQVNKFINAETVIKVRSHESYHSEVAVDNITIISYHETCEFVSYEKFKKMNVEYGIRTDKSELTSAIAPLLSLKPIHSGISFTTKPDDSVVIFKSKKNMQTDMKSVMKYDKGKNPEGYSGSFNGGQIKKFINSLNTHEKIWIGLDADKRMNVLQTKNCRMISHTLELKGI